ncbi:hypothetical protein ABZT47_14765 [Sphaerisporangium sp. NPDC005289]|uniref:FXSXX-COOH protein n=1 Tax=Sphaerisporangium rhizosphaerae TaxID=2269375 RepID=A0ABW2P8M6_9ACTN
MRNSGDGTMLPSVEDLSVLPLTQLLETAQYKDLFDTVPPKAGVKVSVAAFNSSI